MQSFEWVDARSVEHAIALLGESGPGTCIKAGGLDLLDLMKEGLVAPRRVINIKTVPGLGAIDFDAAKGLKLGALVTLAEIAADAGIQQRFRALVEQSLAGAFILQDELFVYANGGMRAAVADRFMLGSSTIQTSAGRYLQCGPNDGTPDAARLKVADAGTTAGPWEGLLTETGTWRP